MTWSRSSSALLVDPNKGKGLALAREESQIKGISPEMLFYSTCYWLALFTPHITPQPFHLMRQKAETRSQSSLRTGELTYWIISLVTGAFSGGFYPCPSLWGSCQMFMCLFDTDTHWLHLLLSCLSSALASGCVSMASSDFKLRLNILSGV